LENRLTLISRIVGELSGTVVVLACNFSIRARWTVMDVVAASYFLWSRPLMFHPETTTFVRV